MIHHQHFFPVVNPSGRLMAAFLAVINTQADSSRSIARNCERVLTARLRDAGFFFDADRRVRLDDRLPTLSTVLFHKKLGQLSREGAPAGAAGPLARRRSVRAARRG